jgi:hypothetical protein
MLTVRN